MEAQCQYCPEKPVGFEHDYSTGERINVCLECCHRETIVYLFAGGTHRRLSRRTGE